MGLWKTKTKTKTPFPRPLSPGSTSVLHSWLFYLLSLPFHSEWCMGGEGLWWVHTSSSLLLLTPHASRLLQHGVPPMGCSSFREYQPGPLHGASSQQAAVWTSAPMWSSPQATGKYVLHCGLSHGNICFRPGEAVEVIEHKTSENMPGCAPVLGATVGSVGNSDSPRFNW